MNRGDLTNEQWERLKPLLPPQKPHTGHPASDHRTLVIGHLHIRPKRVAGDKGYAFRKYRRYLHRRGMRTTIPRKKNKHATGPFDRELSQQRNQVERLINRLKQFRRVATRYDKLASSYAAMSTIAMILLWL